MIASRGLTVQLTDESLLDCLWTADLTIIGGSLVLDASELSLSPGDSFCLFRGEVEGEWAELDVIGISCLEPVVQSEGGTWFVIFSGSTCSRATASSFF